LKILIVDDEPNILSAVGSALKRSGYDILTAGSFAEATNLLHGGIDVAFLDVWLGDGDGIQLLKLIKERYPETECVMISGHAEIETADSAVKSGAYDFLEKPLSLDRIEVVLGNIARLKSIENERNDLLQRLDEDTRLVGQSKAVADLKKLASKVAPEESRVLITGENGTGKELIARMIHEASPRNKGPFVAVNCAALPEDLIESELFGFEKGAFTGAVKAKPGRFEMAGGGTLFLDEIGEMSEKTQAKLLRAVEEGVITRLGGTVEIKTDVRIISATNKDLKKSISEGKYREDLYYRLAVLPIEIPPLRERREDIPLLVQHFSDRFCRKRGRPKKKFSTDALKLFSNYAYPGNIRELANYVERVVIMAPGDSIKVADLETLIPHLVQKELTGTLKAACEQFEKEYIKKSISQAGGNMTRAAEILGLERSHLYKKMKALGMNPKNNNS
jgi:two-component system nitrogen regulation response regulator NtrX